MQHIVMFSGGVASYVAAKRVAERYGIENLILLFGDTLIEDEDSYRFLIEASANIYGLPINKKYLDSLNIPPLEQMDKRRDRLHQLSKQAREYGLTWLQDGRHIWEVFQDERFLNHRTKSCSLNLKIKPCREYINELQEDLTIYVGIDWTEYERMEKINKGWSPYKVEAPLCWDDIGWLDRKSMFEFLEREGIKPPRLYQYGFPHGNCGGDVLKQGNPNGFTFLKHSQIAIIGTASKSKNFVDYFTMQQSLRLSY